MTVDDAIQTLKQKRGNFRCSDMEDLLCALGFKVKPNRRGGHRSITHPKLQGFHGSSFNGGHGADGIVKAGYCRKITLVLLQYHAELDSIQRENA